MKLIYLLEICKKKKRKSASRNHHTFGVSFASEYLSTLLAHCLKIEVIPTFSATTKIMRAVYFAVLFIALFTQTVEGDEAYIDKKHQNVPFGEWSADLLPYRAWSDTRPASTLLKAPGFNLNNELSSSSVDEVQKTIRVLSLSGFVAGRVEIGMGSFSFDDTSKFADSKTYTVLKRNLLALKKNNIRPLILLNSNSGYPYPLKEFSVKLLRPAKKGDRAIYIESASKIRPGYTGLTGQSYATAYPLITEIKPGGECILSAPLKKDIKPGTIKLREFKYQPFAAGTILADGTPNPAAEESLRGWADFVLNSCRIVQDILGTKGQADAGFDVEIWNEYSFGSDHLTGRYYSPKRKFKKLLKYKRDGLTVKGVEVILPVAVDIISDPKNGFPGVRIVSGLANQRPWDNGADMWPGQYGISRHYYSGINPGDWKPDRAEMPTRDIFGEKQNPPCYAPPGPINMPEFWLTARKSEMMSRDLQPFPNPFPKHFRFSLNPVGDYARVWMSEYNFYRGEWSKKILEKQKISEGNRRFSKLMESIATKALIRSLVFLSHKGVETIYYYAPKQSLSTFGLLPESFFTKLPLIDEDDNRKLLAVSGMQMQAMRRLISFMKNSAPVQVPRRLEVVSVTGPEKLVLQKGNGTAQHPNKYPCDFAAILPFQMDQKRYAVGVYVVTPDMVRVWDSSRGVLNPARYNMPPQELEILFRNISGDGAKCSLFDPITGKIEGMTITESGKDFLKVKLMATDYPRMLEITEPQAGPMILSPTLKGDELCFSSNISASYKVEWGKYPERTGKGAIEGKISGGEVQKIKLKDFNKKDGLTIPFGGAWNIKLKGFNPKDGVRITLKSNGLTTRWPQWDYDPQGTVRQGRLADSTASSANTQVGVLPKLPSAERPLAVSSCLKIKIIGDKASTLPTTSVADSVSAVAIKIDGFYAWKVTIKLDASSHPGEEDLYRYLLIVPLRKDFALIEIKANEKEYRRALDLFNRSIKNLKVKRK